MENEDRLRAALADRYRIEKKIGAGGMATVYLAWDLKHDRPVAVKVLDPELAHGLGSSRFLKEIKTTANLTHPHILPVFDSGEADGFLYYVLPYVKGESLRARLAKERQLPVDEAVRIAREIAGALAYAHDEGIIHRDVKPANIMLEAGQAVLGDFGVAHAVAEASDERLTRAKTSPGTPSYMSPEQASGTEDLDGRSDIYSLGCVLYELLAGEPPFTGSTPAAILARKVQGRLPSLLNLRPGLPGWLVEATEKALVRVPADRHQTATEFLQALKAGWASDHGPKGPPVRFGKGKLVGAFAAAILFLFGVSKIFDRGTESRESWPSTGVRVAVTYFNVASEDPALAALGDALTEYVADGLVQLGTLDVLPLSAMLPHKGVGLSNQAVEELGIDAYVEGSVMGTADRVTVSVQLIDAADLRHIESEMVAGNAGEPFAILEDLAGQVSGLLRQWLGIRFEMASLQAGTESETAWSLLQEGGKRLEDAIDLAGSGDTVAARGRLQEADALLGKAESEDPSFVSPIVERGWVALEYASLGGSSSVHDPDWTRVGVRHAERALEKDPDNPGALELRGVLLDYLAEEAASDEEVDSLRSAAEQDLLRATELDETRSQAFVRLSSIYREWGRLAESKLAARKAYLADPYQMEAVWVLFSLCSSSLELREWTEVSGWCGEGRTRFPEEPAFASAELAALAGPEGPLPAPDLAWHLADEVIRLSPPHERDRAEPPQFLQVAAVLARAGLPDSARAVLNRTLALPAAEGPRTYVQEANARLRLGDVDGALDALARFLEASPSDRASMPTDWWWEEIWDHPGFLALLDSVEGGPGGG